MIKYVMRMVLDTNVVVAAMRSPTGASAELLRMAVSRKIQLVASATLCIEYESVCHREEHRRAAGFSRGDTDVFLDAVVDLIEPVEVWFFWRPQLRDAGDELVLDAAVNGRAKMLVTFNLRDFDVVSGRFGISVLTPSGALMRVL